MKFKSEKQRKAVMSQYCNTRTKTSSRVPFADKKGSMLERQLIEGGKTLVKLEDDLNFLKIKRELIRKKKPFDEQKFIENDGKIDAIEERMGEESAKILKIIRKTERGKK